MKKVAQERMASIINMVKAADQIVLLSFDRKEQMTTKTVLPASMARIIVQALEVASDAMEEIPAKPRVLKSM